MDSQDSSEEESVSAEKKNSKEWLDSDPFYGFEPDVSLIAIWPPLTITFHYHLQT